MRVDEEGQRRAVAVVADIGVMGPEELIARDALTRRRPARQAEIGRIGEDRGQQRDFLWTRLAGQQVGARRKKAGFLRHTMKSSSEKRWVVKELICIGTLEMYCH